MTFNEFAAYLQNNYGIITFIQTDSDFSDDELKNLDINNTLVENMILREVGINREVHAKFKLDHNKLTLDVPNLTQDEATRLCVYLHCSPNQYPADSTLIVPVDYFQHLLDELLTKIVKMAKEDPKALIPYISLPVLVLGVVFVKLQNLCDILDINGSDSSKRLFHDKLTEYFQPLYDFMVSLPKDREMSDRESMGKAVEFGRILSLSAPKIISLCYENIKNFPEDNVESIIEKLQELTFLLSFLNEKLVLVTKQENQKHMSTLTSLKSAKNFLQFKPEITKTETIANALEADKGELLVSTTNRIIVN